MASLSLIFILLLFSEAAVADLCQKDFRAQWPLGLADEDLHWRPNAKEDQSGPKYRLFTTVDVREVMPKLAYHCKSSTIINIANFLFVSFMLQLSCTHLKVRQ